MSKRRMLLVFTILMSFPFSYLFFKMEFMTFSSQIFNLFNSSVFDDDSSSLENSDNSDSSKVLRNSSSPEGNKNSLRLVVIISTAPHRRARRDVIRKTYWRYCYNNSQVKCYFFTDGNVTSNVSRELQEENQKYRDMILQPLAGGKEFGLRFLYQIQWAASHHDFEYFLRADDDYFICLSRLFYELEHRPKNNLVWGFFHCYKDLVWMDEAWMVFSKDIIHRFLSQNKTTIVCHPHADQQIAIWMNDIPTRRYFYDVRLHHFPRASQTNKFDNVSNKICDTFMGIHGAFGDKMLELDKMSNDGKKDDIPEIKKFESICDYKGFKWTEMNAAYRFEPKPCIEKPNWSQGHQAWKGAEEGQW